MGLKPRRTQREVISHERSDAWVLLAIHLGDGGRGTDLRMIISVGDYINHAIFTYDELAGGLMRLIAAKLVSKRGSLYRTRAAARAIFTEVKSRRTRQWRLQAQRFLGVEYQPGQPPPPAVPPSSAPFTPREFDEAYKAYRKSF